MSSHLRRIDGNEARQISRFCTAQLTVTDGVATMQIGGSGAYKRCVCVLYGVV
jgi:hypothetical protein